MLLRNFYNLIAAWSFIGTTHSNLTVKLYNGNTSVIGGNSGAYTVGYMNCSNMANNENGYGFQLGSGTTPPTFDDYKLESMIPVSNYSAVCSPSYDVTSDGILTVSVTITVTNTSSSTYTISEIGRRAYAKGSSSSIYPMFERIVLDNPITLEPNGVGQILYTFTHTIKSS